MEKERKIYEENIFKSLDCEEILTKLKLSNNQHDFDFYSCLLLCCGQDKYINTISDIAEEKKFKFKFFKSFFRSMITSSISSYIYEKNGKIFSSTQDDYNKIIDTFLEFASSLNITDSVELCHLFTNLLYNGTFSVTSKHHYSKKSRMNIANAYGYDVFNGTGVCLQFSDLLTDVLTRANIKSACLVNAVENVERGYKPNIERGIDVRELSILAKAISVPVRLITKNIGSHAFTLVSPDNNKPYIYDSTNITMFNCISCDKAKIISGKGIVTLNPSFSLYMAKSSNNIEAFCDLQEVEDNDGYYDEKFFIDSIEEIINKCEKNKEEIETFHQEILPHAEKILEKVRNNK